MSSLKINGAEIENWNAGSRDGYWKAHWGLGVVFKRLLASDFLSIYEVNFTVDMKSSKTISTNN